MWLLLRVCFYRFQQNKHEREIIRCANKELLNYLIFFWTHAGVHQANETNFQSIKFLFLSLFNISMEKICFKNWDTNIKNSLVDILSIRLSANDDKTSNSQIFHDEISIEASKRQQTEQQGKNFIKRQQNRWKLNMRSEIYAQSTLG